MAPTKPTIAELRAKAAAGELSPADLLQVAKLRSARKLPAEIAADPVQKKVQELAEMVRDYRDQHGLTVVEFGAKAGLDHSYISQLETGRFVGINLKNVLKLAEACGKDLVFKDKPKRKKAHG
jgi:ribosome-binding protein aMBF1 (putative translation factor)